MLSDLQNTPWPWFGGKARAAEHVWAAMGDPAHYAEPFCGTCAVLLRRPALANRTYYSETVNDADGLLVNALRGIQLHPDATAEAASWFVAEADLTARHLALVKWRADNDLGRLFADPAWCDPVMAGWWIWGCSAWIGGGWCAGTGPWHVGADGRITKQRPGPRQPGVASQLPNISNDGVGVNRPQAREPGVQSKLPNISNDGVGVNRPQAREPGVAGGEPDEWQEADFHPMTMPETRRWFAFLSARLRHVRILNGDWTRLVTNGALKTLSVRQDTKGTDPDAVCGVFLDPPYADTAGRASNLYAHDDEQVAHAVRAWAIAHGGDRQLRIVVAGFDGEDGGEFEAAGWRAVEWYKAGYLRGGMGNIGGGEGESTSQQGRERLWASPFCLRAEEPKLKAQLSLFEEAVR